MAFTEAQKVKIRFYLGFPDVFRYANTRLESAIDVIGGRAETQTEVESVLARLVVIETAIESSLSTAGLKRAEDVEWYQGGAAGTQIEGKRAEGKAYCSRLSIIFGIPLQGDAFGTGGYRGDNWMGRQFQYGGNPFGMC